MEITVEVSCGGHSNRRNSLRAQYVTVTVMVSV